MTTIHRDKDMTNKKSVNKAIRLAVLWRAQNEGLLKDKTCQQIADAFGAGNRSTASRDLRDLDAVRDMYDQVEEAFREAIK